MRNAFVAAGLKRYDDLLTLNPAQLAATRFQQKTRQQSIGPSRAPKIQQQIRVLTADRLEIIAPPERLPEGPVVYFDIESNPWEERIQTRVHLWGLLLHLGDGTKPSYWGAIAAPGDGGDKEAWQAFLSHAMDLMDSRGALPFVHYSAYEKAQIKAYLERWGDADGVADRLLLWDMKAKAISGHLCLPVYSYGLKPVEKCAGFKRSQGDFGSLWSIGRYNAFLEATNTAEREAIKQELLIYNKQDCKAMRHVLQWASRLA